MYPRHPSWPWHNTDTSAPRCEPLEVSDTTEPERESPPPHPPPTTPSPYRAPSLTPTHEMNNLSLPCYLISFLTLYSNYSCMFILPSCFPFCCSAVWFLHLSHWFAVCLRFTKTNKKAWRSPCCKKGAPLVWYSP